MSNDSSPVVDTIVCADVSKRYLYEWVLRKFSYSFKLNYCYGIKGPNGSGKSTLLKLLCGHATPSKGQITYYALHQVINVSEIFGHVTFAAPYIELIDEMTVTELLIFHHSLRPFVNFNSTRDEVAALPFKGLMDKRVGELSSGMKQRIKLLLAITTRTNIILLDEPGSNLDAEGKMWFENLLKQYRSGKIVIIASNDNEDLIMIDEFIDLLDYK